VITPSLFAYIYPQIIQGIDDTAHDKRYNIVLASSKGNLEKEMLSLEQLLEKGVDGLLIEPAAGFQRIQESKTFQALKNLSIPVVFVDWVIDEPNVSYVSINDFEGGFTATNYLAEAGHTRIAYVYPNDHIPFIQRYQGYRKALEAHRIEYDSRLDKATTVAKWNEDNNHIIPLVKELLDLGDQRPSAIFFFNDEAALCGYTAIREAGLKIPDDISVIGFDDSELAAVGEISLTSVIHPKYMIGKWAAELLFEAIEHEGQTPPRQMLINPTIAVRNSVKFI
jgi:GntR family transcriptional regulator of arabinose operon